ncbi:MAG: hypothetical protein K2J73_05655 [Oscillospiraceae bacterium]|nr:hypothetical protein [Oscillospiraceae bacterium]
MPKMRMKASEDKDKIRQLRQDIKDMKIDMKETFSVMETMEKPEKKRQSQKKLWIPIFVAAVLIIAAAAYILLTAL